MHSRALSQLSLTATTCERDLRCQRGGQELCVLALATSKLDDAHECRQSSTQQGQRRWLGDLVRLWSRRNRGRFCRRIGWGGGDAHRRGCIGRHAVQGQDKGQDEGRDQQHQRTRSRHSVSLLDDLGSVWINARSRRNGGRTSLACAASASMPAERGPPRCPQGLEAARGKQSISFTPA